MKHRILVIGSQCARASIYARFVADHLKERGLGEQEVEVRQTARSGSWNGEDLFKKYGLSDRCTISYCQGCNFLKYAEPGVKYLPALVVDDVVVLHSCFPTKEQLDEIFCPT